MGGTDASIELAYAELGLAPGASEAEVRAAWRRLVSRWHPDRNASAEAVDLMQRINRAYESIRRETAGAAPAIRRRVRLTLEEAAFGCTKALRFKQTHRCDACAGAGVLDPAASCPSCDGAGSVRSSAWFGWFTSQSRCAACEGRGRVAQRCGACGGRGRSSTAYRRSVRIPAGAREGDLLSMDSAEGAVELHVKVSRHPLFAADDDGTLRCEVPIDGYAWLANAWIDVPTLAGLKQLRLQRGRHVYRLRGEGLPLERRGSARGDYLVTVVPAFPDTLSEQQQALLEQLLALPHDAPESLRAWRGRLQAWQQRR